MKSILFYQTFQRRLKKPIPAVGITTALLCMMPVQNLIAESFPSQHVVKSVEPLPVTEHLAVQQTRQVFGKVTDTNGEPVIGANVVEK